MRVLWFSNTQAVGTNTGTGCSWIGSLESELAKISTIKLGISYITEQIGAVPYSDGKTIYYPISKKPARNKLHKLFLQLTHKIESEDKIGLYLDVIQDFKPDIIHIFGTESDFGLIIQKLQIPCIIHIQGNLTVVKLKWFSGLSSVEIVKNSKKWHLIKGIGLYHDYFKIKKSAAREIQIFRTCRYFMGRTDWDRRLSSVLSWNSRYFHCDEIIRSEFYINQWQPKNSPLNYVIHSTIMGSIYKGLETIFECKQILNQCMPESNIIWKIAGIDHGTEISTIVKNKFKTRFEDIGIKLLGRLQENELIDELLKSDLFVHASHIENSPNSVCEAMVLGMPVIATYAGGTPSVLSDKSEGLLVQDGDPYALAGAIIELLRDREFAKSLGVNARKKSLQRNDPKKIVNDVLSIYSSILSGN